MVKIKTRSKKLANFPHSPVASILKKIGEEEGISVEIEPGWEHVGKITRQDGTVTYLRGDNFDLNGMGAAEIAKDKGYATYFLKQAGYRVIPTGVFYCPEFAKILKSRDGQEAAYRYAKKIGFPVIIKPNNLSQGKLVCLVYDRRSFMQATRKICKIDRVFLVQPKVSGRDYRLVVLDQEVISAYERLPLTVRGDGLSTISELLDKKQKKFLSRGRDTIINKTDFRISLKLERLGLGQGAVLARGQDLALLDNHNLSAGGQAVDLTDEIDNSYKSLAVKIAQDMGLRYCGVDLMVEKDIRGPINFQTNNYFVIEVNAAPGVDHYAKSGNKQKRIVKEMYRKILKKLAGT